MTAADSYRRQNLKLEYLHEDSLQQPNYVPLPAGRILIVKCLHAESLSTKTVCRQIQITRI